MNQIFHSELFEYVYFLGIGQAILLAILLLKRKVNNLANRFLAAVFILSALELISGLFYLNYYYKLNNQFIGLTNGFAYLFGPLFYFFITSLAANKKQFRLKSLLHFVPFLIFYSINLYQVISFSPDEKIRFAEISFNANNFTDYFGIIAPFHATVYLFFCLKTANKILVSLKNSFSSFEFINLYWLKYFYFAMIFEVLLVLLLHLLEFLFLIEIQHFMYASLAFIIYFTGYITLRQPEVEKNLIETPTIKSNIDNAVYKKSGLVDKDINNLLDNLNSVIGERKPYLNPKLTLKDLSEMTEISPHNLSELLNTKLSKSFYDFINYYRVEEVKRLIKEDIDSKFNLLSLAFEAGFSSKAAFNTIFKKFTNLTPTEYKTSLKN